MKPADYPYDLAIETYESRLRMLPFSANPSLSAAEQADALYWLKAGLIWMYNFHHEESIQCFKHALVVDPLCAMAHWGISCSNGPNYNAPCMNRDCFPSAQDAHRHAQEARRLSEDPRVRGALSDTELALIAALQCRFNPVGPDDGQLVNQNTAAYAEAMEAVYAKYGDEPCVACTYAEALMNFHPWKLWDLDSGVAAEHTDAARAVLQTALSRAPLHPGLNHFYVHLMEMSCEPQAALASCAALRTLCPDAGHLVHMPSHIYVLLGMWDEAVAANEEGHRADEKYREREGIHNSYSGYRLHNIHFICYAAMFAGQFEVAMRGARRLHANLPESLVSDPILGPFFEAFHSIDMHVLVRFGKWTEILSSPIPENQKIWPYRTATVYYARGIAYAITGDVEAARAELTRFEQAARRVPPAYTLHNNTCVDMLQVAAAMLVGEIEYRAGNMVMAFDNLRKAVALSDGLNYDEPWGWMQPPRHALGALLLEQGHLDESEAVFRKDMDPSYYGRCHPDNLWALAGLASCLKEKARASGSTEAGSAEIAEIEAKLALLRERADTDVSVACMCAGMIAAESSTGAAAKRRKMCCDRG